MKLNLNDLQKSIINKINYLLKKQEVQTKRFLSIVVNIDDFNFQQIADNCKINELFYLKERDNKYRFIAIGSVFRKKYSTGKSFQNFIDDFQSLIVSNNSKQLKNLPLFIGSIGFNQIFKSKEWSDFNSSFFIPELLIFNETDKTLLLFNFKLDKLQTENHIKREIEKRIEYLIYNKKKKSGKIKIVSRSQKSDYKEWNRKVNKVLNQINKTKVEKVVLARRVTEKLSGKPSVKNILESFTSDFSTNYNFIYKKEDSIFYGSSPEKLFSLKNNLVQTEAIAGTVKRGRRNDADKMLGNDLLNSSKNLIEHKFVIDHFKDGFDEKEYKVKIDETIVQRLKKVQHLKTIISIRKNRGRFQFNNLFQKIFPTPAVCGKPKRLAKKIIGREENFERGLYSGTIGWFNLNNNAEFIVAIRSALINKNIIYKYGGCGIVQGSEADDEYRETELKIESIPKIK